MWGRGTKNSSKRGGGFRGPPPPPKCKPKATPPIEWLWFHAALLLRIHPRIPTGDHCLGEIQVARSATDFGIFLHNGEKCRSHNRSGTPYFRPVGGPSSKQPSPSYFRPVVGGWGPFFNQNNQALDQKKSKPGAMIVLFFSKQPSPSYFRPVVVVGEPFFNQNNQVLDQKKSKPGAKPHT